MSNQDFEECNKVLLRAFNLCFTFDKSEILKAKKEVKRNFDLWLRTATKNRNGKESDWNINFPPRPLNKDTHQSFSTDQLQSVYMLDGEGVEEWAKAGCLLIAEKGKELNTLKSLQIGHSFEASKQFRISKMNDWSEYGTNSSPCTDIILVDPYIFAQSDYEHEINSYALLEQLCRWAKNSEINIVIFTLKNYRIGSTDNQDVNFIAISRQLKERLEQTIGVVPKITFVLKARHDRTIFTNYKMFVSGDSFKYFKDGVNVSQCTHGDWVYISSYINDDNLNNTKEFLVDLQKVVDGVKGKPGSILGDLQSNFLNFCNEEE